jgi:hypothetical protein
MWRRFGPFRNDGCGAVDAGGAVRRRAEEPGKADEVTHRVFVAARFVGDDVCLEALGVF